MLRYRLLPVIALLIAPLSLLSQDQNGPKLPSGLRIPATLKASLSSQKAKPGDTIKLDVFSAVHGKDGKVVIPSHATLTGTVTQAVPFHGAEHPGILAFAVQRAEWKGGQGTLDAAVFGVLAISDFRKPGFAAIGPKDEYEMAQPLRGATNQGEKVEDVDAATLRHEPALDIVDNRTLNWVPGTPMSSITPVRLMELKLSTDPAVRTYFTAEKSDVELPREFLVVLLNGMKVVQ
ncbi:MAG: hypothetical protein WBX03_02565 [Terriglobales bacterium]